jgi:hypothetical protein
MSLTTEQKNIECTPTLVKSEWEATFKVLLKKFYEVDGYVYRLKAVRHIFDYLVSDLSWKIFNNMNNFLNIIADKLYDFKNHPMVTLDDKQYFRHIEEQFGFFSYCHGITLKGFSCGNQVNYDRKQSYCCIHKKKIRKIFIKINKTLLICSDVSMLIAQYV